ncbi:hypothetical protein ACQV2E_16585 [Pantoea allii]|uniref:hypothetical protein n=1 Tax=Pantoea allii TaxID=574096 RepID=UPI003D310B89
MKVKNALHSVLMFFRTNPHLGPSILLFSLGMIFLVTLTFSAVAGALFGAGASLLGAWISDFNSRKKEIESKKQKECDAEKYLTPELLRTVSKILSIQDRAIINYANAARENNISGILVYPLNADIQDKIELGDKKEDFLPYLPMLYPNVPQFRDLSGNKAVKLIAYYDSLYDLETFVKDWWKREGQVPSNIFNQISHQAERSLALALECLKEFKIENSVYGIGHSKNFSSQIASALDGAIKTRERSLADFEKIKKNYTG